MRYFHICGASPRNLIILVGKRYETALWSVMDLDVTSFMFVITNSMEHIPSSEANRPLVKEFPVFYGTRSYITTFTTAHLSLSWAR
jgi:hypothetical protein